MTELDQAIAQATANAQSHEEGFRLSLEAIVPLANRQWFLANEGLEVDDETAKAYRDSRDELCRDIELAKQEGVFDPALPTLWIAETYENLTYAAWSMVRSGEATASQAAGFAWQTFSNGLKGKTK